VSALRIAALGLALLASCSSMPRDDMDYGGYPVPVKVVVAPSAGTTDASGDLPASVTGWLLNPTGWLDFGGDKRFSELRAATGANVAVVRGQLLVDLKDNKLHDVSAAEQQFSLELDTHVIVLSDGEEFQVTKHDVQHLPTPVGKQAVRTITLKL